MRKKIFIDKQILIYIIIFFIVSITSIYSFTTFLYSNNLVLIKKQIIYYILGFIFIFLIQKIGIKKILKLSLYIYLVNVLLLLLVLIFGKEINGIKAWFNIPYIGSFQPSEFMKIGITLVICNLINNFNKKNTSFKDEFILIIKIGIIILIPGILTFLEPDTGAVIVYLLIMLICLFISDISKGWLITLISLVIISIGLVIGLYYFNEDLFIKILGSNFFYRLDRLLDWANSSGMQLENSVIAIASSNFFGNGINNILIYYPEGHTDFIFSSFASIYGLFGIMILITTIVLFDIKILNISKKVNNNLYKYIIITFLSIILWGQIQNIAMTIGILPIMGITLPFISYGGSSLISYMIMLGIILAIEKEYQN